MAPHLVGDCDGKWRPAILLYPTTNGWWHVMGLTTLATFADGHPRHPVVDWMEMGLAGPGSYWGERSTTIPARDVGEPIGHITAYETAQLFSLLADPDEQAAFHSALTRRGAP